MSATSRRLKGAPMIGTARMNEYSESHGYEGGAERTLCGVLVSLHTITLPDLTFPDQAPQPYCQSCVSRLS